MIALSSIHPAKIYVRKMVSNGPIIGLFLGTGFSFTSSKGGYPTTDEDLASELLEGLTQYMLLASDTNLVCQYLQLVSHVQRLH